MLEIGHRQLFFIISRCSQGYEDENFYDDNIEATRYANPNGEAEAFFKAINVG